MFKLVLCSCSLMMVLLTDATAQQSPLRQQGNGLFQGPYRLIEAQFTRAFLAGQRNTALPLTLSGYDSGTMMFGLGLSYYPLKNVPFAIKFSPSLNFYNLAHDNRPNQSFFAVTTQPRGKTLLRLMYYEMPIGISYAFKFNAAGTRKKGAFDAGISIGRLLDATVKLTEERNQLTAVVVDKFEDKSALNFFRMGIYSRLSYRMAGIWVYYRLLGVFKDGLTHADGSKQPFPDVDRLEVGFSLTL